MRRRNAISQTTWSLRGRVWRGAFLLPLALAGMGMTFVAMAQTKPARPKFTPIPKEGKPAANPAGVPAAAVADVGQPPPGPGSAAPMPSKPKLEPAHAAFDVNQPTPVPAYSPKGLIVYYIGQRNGEIEPCGCVKNQLGGIQYEAEIYSMTPREQNVRIDVGAWNTGFFNPEVALKTGYGLRAMGGHLDMDAVNVSRQDLELGKAYFDNLREKNPEALERLISANVYVRAQPDQLAFQPYRLLDRKTADGKDVKVAIIGVTANVSPLYPTGDLGRPDSSRDYMIKDPKVCVGETLEQLRGKADIIIVASHTNWDDAAALAKAYPEIDFMLTPLTAAAHEGRIEGTPASYGAVWGAQGKYVSRADLVRASGGDERRWAMEGAVEHIGVSPKALKAHQELVELIADFKKQTESLSVDPPADAKRVYAGSNSCVSCHVKEFQSWKETRHSHALETLVAKGSQFDPECLKCHTVGFRQDNGFYTIRASMTMANVQCENCHGPAAEHVDRENFIKNGSIQSLGPNERELYLADAKKALPAKAVPESTCVQCHQGENDPHFNYAEKIVKVNHSQSAAASTEGAAQADKY